MPNQGIVEIGFCRLFGAVLLKMDHEPDRCGMTYFGTVRNGVIVLPPDVTLPEGAAVDVTVRAGEPTGNALPEEVLKLAKPRTHLPPDYALNHGHYVRGEPRK
jgi:hypothetical protein